jgi:iron complex outermembrane receptor protein
MTGQKMELHLLKQGVWRRRLLALVLGAGAGSVAAETAPLAEDGYLGELPVVLSVTRLAQSLADTPGAVTVIDRDMIRRSGARQVSELLRFVPGFIVSGWNGANPITQYHTKLDEYGSRLQVFVDGRSVYSSLFLGDTHRGLGAVVLEDIERIEVLRGSNSAAYGANAFLGVINIITRNSADTRGTLISGNAGSGGIGDYTMRYGWGDDSASYRLTASQRSDDGYKQKRVLPLAYSGVDDGTQLRQVTFRSDMRLGGGDELQFQLGVGNHRADDGDGTVGNAPRPTTNKTAFALLKYAHQVSAVESVNVLASFDDEDFASVQREMASGIVVPVDTGGRSQRKYVEFSNTRAWNEQTRTVWGMAWRQESAQSTPLFNSGAVFQQTQIRLFGNVEWRLAPQWLLNAGGLIEENSKIGSSFAPRLMLNYQPHPEHTLRIGSSKATRAPSLFELYGNNPVYYQGVMLFREVVATGKARPEEVVTNEIGYLGDMRRYGLTVDARIYDESIDGLLSQNRYAPAAPSPLGPDMIETNDYVNKTNARLKGAEYQVQWRPLEGTRLLWSQARVKSRSVEQDGFDISSPHTNYSLAWFQDLSNGWEMALMYSYMGSMSWRGEHERIPAYDVVNARLARRFRLGGNNYEVAATVQAWDGDHYEFVQPSAKYPLVPVVQRRAFMTVRVEF